MSSFSLIYSNIDIFLLILARISSFVLVSPIFGRKGIPNTTKIGLSLILGISIILNMPQIPQISNLNSGLYIALLAKEALIGMSVSFLSFMFFSVFYAAGQLADMNMGFNVGGLYDAQMQMQVPLTGNLFYTIGLFVFLSTKGATKLIFLLYSMFDTIPIQGTEVSGIFYEIFINSFSFTYAYAVKIILPLLLLTLITQFVLGVIIKFVPQMNVFVIGIPVKIAVSMILLIFLVAPLFELLDQYFEFMFERMLLLIRSFV